MTISGRPIEEDVRLLFESGLSAYILAERACVVVIEITRIANTGWQLYYEGHPIVEVVRLSVGTHPCEFADYLEHITTDLATCQCLTDAIRLRWAAAQPKLSNV